MKKLFVIYCLLFIIHCSVLSAQVITVSGLEVKSSGTSSTVTFDVAWLRSEAAKDSAWVFVDYNNQGTMSRLLVTGATASPGTVHKPNNQGAWLVTNATPGSSFSAEVQLFTEITDFHGACAYAINYPPVGQYKSYNTIWFTGTPPFELTFTGGSTTRVEKEQSKPYTITAGTLGTFTDASQAPGLIKCKTPAEQTTLNASATGYCKGTPDVLLTLSNTENGAVYQLYKNNEKYTGKMTGTGGAVSFSGPFEYGTYTAKVEETAAFCAADVAGARTITENPLPIAPTISQPANVCQNSSNLVFTASGYSGVLTWIANGNGSESGNTVTIGSSTSGLKTVKAQSSQTYLNAPTCYSAEVEKSATVYVLPGAPEATGGGTQCGGTREIRATVGTNGASIKWLNDNNTTSPRQVGSGTWRAVSVSSAGCSGTAGSSVVVTINAVPDIPTGPSSNARCGNGSVVFGATVPSDCTIDWYTAPSGGSLVSGGQGVVSFSSPSLGGTTPYYAQARVTATGCTSTGRLSVTGTVHPVPTVVINPPTTITEPNTSVLLTATASNGSGYSYSWSGSGSANTKTVYAPASNVTETHACTVTSTGNCTATATASVTGKQTSPPEGSPDYTPCPLCCFDGSSWVDCFVTTYSHPFTSSSNNSSVSWIGGNTNYFSGARSPKDGQANSTAILSGGGTLTSGAVGICNALGSGWYLPAYEELYAMSSAPAHTSSNNQPGANILKDAWFWSSTEYYKNGGRTQNNSADFMPVAARTRYNGELAGYNKTASYSVHCAWQP